MQALVAEARKPSGGEPARQLLARVLNDSVPAVRSEAFKSVLNLQIGGGGAGALRFASRSIHSDVRREVLTEVIAQVAEPWGLDLLLEFFNDPDPDLRGEAFAFSLKKTRGIEFLEAALGSRYPDLRMKAVEGLVKKHTATAQNLLVRALACLSSRTPRLHLTAARAIEALADPIAFAGFVSGLVNDKGDKLDWNVSEATIDALAEMLVHGEPRLQVRTARLLKHLDAEEQDAFNQAWKIHEARFANELADLRARAGKRKPVPLQYTAGQLQDLAFGAYVGLVREQASPNAKGKGGGPDPQVSKVRQSALAHLLKLAGVEPRHARSALPVFVQALGDPNQAVRAQAFEQAQALGKDSEHADHGKLLFHRRRSKVKDILVNCPVEHEEFG